MEISDAPLCDTEAEQALLSVCLLQEEALLLVADQLKPEHFYYEDHAKVWECIRFLYAKGQFPDMVLVSSQLKQWGKGYEHLYLLPTTLATMDHNWRAVEGYARVVLEFFRRRELKKIAQAMQGGVEHQDSAVVLEQVHKGLLELQAVNTSGFADLAALTQKARDEILLTMSSSRPPGIPSGIPPLDKYIMGFHPQELILIAARPSVGKTTVLLFMAHHLATQGHRLAFFSLEMSSLSLAYRLMSLDTGYPYVDLQSGRLDQRAKEKMDLYLETTKGLPFHIDDTGGISFFELRTRFNRLFNAHPIDALFVDYLGLMSYPGEKNREQEVARISRGLKALAKEFRVPVITAVQLNRQSEQRMNKEPTMADLRDSGSQEQDADKIVLLHSPYRSGVVDANPDDLILMVAKNRNGPTGRCIVTMRASNGRIYEGDPWTQTSEKN